jgi:hypothetical protein
MEEEAKRQVEKESVSSSGSPHSSSSSESKDRSQDAGHYQFTIGEIIKTYQVCFAEFAFLLILTRNAHFTLY